MSRNLLSIRSRTISACQGYTLLELLFTFSVISLLAAIAVPTVFRSKLAESERLSTPQLIRDLNDNGQRAREAAVDDIIQTIAREHRAGDLVLLMSNGGFGGIHQKLLQALGAASAP